MFKKLTATTLLVFLLASLAACGGKSKKKKVDNLGTNDGQSRAATNKDDDKNLSLNFVEEEMKGIQNRMKEAKFFDILREGIGHHQIIYFPARDDSRNPADHDERWYFRNTTSDASNIAYRIYPKDGQELDTTFEFKLSPVVEQDIEDIVEVSKLKLDLADNSSSAKVTITCGKINEVYEISNYAANVNIAYYPLNQDDESYNHFQSPCAIYLKEEIENGIAQSGNLENDTIEIEEKDDLKNEGQLYNDGEHVFDENNNEVCDDQEAEATEEKQPCPTPVTTTSCNESRFMRYHVKVICQHRGQVSNCSQVITPVGIITKSSTEISCEATCSTNESSCSSTEISTEVTKSELAAAGELTDHQLLPFCSSRDQRVYMRRSEKVQEVEEEISSLVSYCANRPELGKHCKAAEMHDLHKKIDRKKKDQAKIITKCIEARDKDAARGDYSQPEMNTCGFITRWSLTSHRNKLNSHQAKLSHLKAECKSAGKCDNKKEEKLQSKIEHRQHKITKLEKKCNVK